MQNESMIFSFQKCLVICIFLSAFVTKNINKIFFSLFSYRYYRVEELGRAFIKS